MTLYNDTRKIFWNHIVESYYRYISLQLRFSHTIFFLFRLPTVIARYRYRVDRYKQVWLYLFIQSFTDIDISAQDSKGSDIFAILLHHKLTYVHRYIHSFHLIFTLSSMTTLADSTSRAQCGKCQLLTAVSQLSQSRVTCQEPDFQARCCLTINSAL